MQFEELWSFPVKLLGVPIALRYLLRMDTWTRGDALRIILFIDPRNIKDHYSFLRLDGVEVLAIDPEFREAEAAWQELANLWSTGTHEEKNAPAYYINWALAKRVPVRWLPWALNEGFIAESDLNAPYIASVNKAALPMGEDRSARIESSAFLGERERDSLYRMIIGMAVAGYAYTPEKRNGVAAEIAADIARLGLNLNDDTIRKHLKLAAEQLPPK